MTNKNLCECGKEKCLGCPTDGDWSPKVHNEMTCHGSCQPPRCEVEGCGIDKCDPECDAPEGTACNGCHGHSLEKACKTCLFSYGNCPTHPDEGKCGVCEKERCNIENHPATMDYEAVCHGHPKPQDTCDKCGKEKCYLTSSSKPEDCEGACRELNPEQCHGSCQPPRCEVEGCGKEKCVKDCVMDMMVGHESHRSDFCHDLTHAVEATHPPMCGHDPVGTVEGAWVTNCPDVSLHTLEGQNFVNQLLLKAFLRGRASMRDSAVKCVEEGVQCCGETRRLTIAKLRSLPDEVGVK